MAMADYCSSPDTLVLSIPNGPSLDLLSDQQGFRVGTLDLGYPDVRDDADLRPDQHGTIDYTRLFGARAVTIAGFLVPSPAGSRQLAWHALAPFLDPGARVTLTYRVDADAVVKTMTLRPAQASATFDNPTVSPAQVGFKAADPLAYDANVQTAITWITAPGGAGRAYPLTFNRVYPPGGTAATYATNHGELTAYPLLRIYGPVGGPSVAEIIGANPAIQLSFPSSFIVNAGDRVDIDCRRRTALLNGNPAQNVFGSLVFNQAGVWPSLPPGVLTNWTMGGSGYSNQTQTVITWADAYLL
jgi:hypothetical protein